MLAAIYARKSTEQNGVSDEEKSVTRQVDHAKAYAATKGWTVAEEHIYVDDGISGAEFVKRPGLERLAKDLKPRPSFDALIMSEESRLGREQFETGYYLKRLLQAGVRVFCYLDDREATISNSMDKMQMSMRGLFSDMEREKAQQRTYDAMLRKARAGHVTGGLVYGYTNVEVFSSSVDLQGRPKRSHVERRVHESQAKVVERIFKECANGKGLIATAKGLNEDGVPTARATNRQGKGWGPSSIREVLFRELYRGVIVWNKTKKRDTWGQKDPTARPESDWIRVDAPALRIVSDKLWKEAHDRLDHTRVMYLRGTDGKLWGRPATGLESKYLLTGLSLCGQCGGSLYVRSRSHGKKRAFFYACTAYNLRGKAVCTNKMEIPLEEADAKVLRQVEADFLRPDVIMDAVRQALERLRPSQDEMEGKRRALVAEVEKLDVELARLATAIAAGGTLSALLEAVKDRERQKAQLTQQLNALNGAQQVGQLDPRRLEKDLRARLADWQGLLQRHVPQARQILKKLLVGRLVFTPNKQGCTFRGESPVDRILAGLCITKAVVSPTGFEPVLPA